MKLTIKRCSACGESKPETAFHRQGDRGRHAYCANCYNARYRGAARKPISTEARRAQNMRSRYGLSPEALSDMLAAQGGVCAICAQVPQRPCIDHDHETGRVRGMLCHPCNIKLPSVEDAEFMTAALRYLGRRP